MCAYRVFVAFCAFLCSYGYAAEFPPVGAVPLGVPFYLDGRNRGMVQLLVMPNPQDSYVQAAPVLDALRPVLADDKIKALSAGVAYGFLPLKHGIAEGVIMRFDEVLVAVIATIPSESKKQQSLLARGQYDLSTGTITPPSATSAYLNVRGSQDYVERSFPGQQEGRLPFRMSADGAVNLRRWVLESSVDYVEQDPDHSWARGDVRVVRDFPEAALRVAAGDLSYPIEGFQSFQPMLGVTIARNFELQPYRVTAPTGQTSFFLISPSRVDVLVNGQRVRTMQLEAGPYSIRDFPVITGNNDATLVITDATGRVEIKKLDIVSDINLLAAGLHKYSYNAGEASRIDARSKIYDPSLPVVSAFHRYGLSDNLTLGANLQSDREQQMIGLDVTIGQRWGVMRADVAASHAADAGSGRAWRLQYQTVDNSRLRDDGSFRGTRNLSLLASYRDRGFGTLGTLQPDNASSFEFAARYGWQASPTRSFGVSGSYHTYRSDRPDDWGASVSVSQRLSNGFNAGINLGLKQAGGFGAFLTLSWTEPRSRHTVTSNFDSFTRASRTDWNYAKIGGSESVSASAGVVRTADGEAANGNLTYFGNRGEAAVRHDLTTTQGENSAAQNATESRSQLRFGTALVYSDGYVAFSRPVSNSFVLFVPTPAIAKYQFGINPRGRGDKETAFEAKTDGPSPAVIPDLTPYYYRTFRIDTSRLPPGFDAGESNYTVYPGNRSGTVIRLGSDANVMLDGTLVYRDGTPVALQAGTIKMLTISDALPQAFFTNRAGRFRIDKLKPGRYVLQLFRYPETTSSIDIPENAAGPTPIGVLMLPVTPGD